MEDGIVKAISPEAGIRAVIASTTSLVEEARKMHQLSFTATAALGRALTGGALLASMLLKEGQVTLKFQGNGPLGRVIVDASPQGTVRGYVEHPEVEVPLNHLGNFDVGAAIGKMGYLQVMVDRGYGMPYVSTVELESGEVGEDINRYLVSSVQTGSVVILGTHLTATGVEASGGLLVQLLPNHTEDTICKLENNLGTFGSITFLMRRGMGLMEILSRLLNGFDVQPLTEVDPLRFECKCSEKRFSEALKLLGKSDLESMAATEGQAEGRCHFCGRVYHVYKDGLLDLARSAH